MYVKAIVLYKKVLFVIGENLLFYKEETISNLPPVDLCLIFEKSSCKNQFWLTEFLACKINSELIFAGYTL